MFGCSLPKLIGSGRGKSKIKNQKAKLQIKIQK
jgi:hypothetical protein